MALRWDDFNPDAKTVRIVRQRVRASHRTKRLKGKIARTALVLPFWWPHYRPSAGWLFTDAQGSPAGDRGIRHNVERLLRDAKLDGPGRGLHDARRTYGRLFLELGGWMDELQRSLGHASIRTTERQYGRFQGEVAAEFARQRIYGEGRLRVLR